MKKRLIIALDGHDGAGKTTLAKALASHLGGVAVRPFSGEVGSQLLDAGKSKNVETLLKIGSVAIENAISSVPDHTPIVLDRGWMTVASFVPESDLFFSNWRNWMPTALCWVDLRTTMSRLNSRSAESPQPLEWHMHYLAVYLELAKRSHSIVVRTDEMDIKTCINELVSWAEHSLKALNE